MTFFEVHCVSPGALLWLTLQEKRGLRSGSKRGWVCLAVVAELELHAPVLVLDVLDRRLEFVATTLARTLVGLDPGCAGAGCRPPDILHRVGQALV